MDLEEPMTNPSPKEKTIAEHLGRILLFPLWIVESRLKRKRELIATKQRQNDAQHEQIKQEKVEHQKAAAKQQASHEASEREAAQFRCQLIYDKHSHLLEGKFSEEKLANYFSKYMNGSIALETVLRRATELEQLITELAGPRPVEKERSFATIRDEFAKKREEAQNSSADPEVLEAIIAELNYQEDQAMMRAARDG